MRGRLKQLLSEEEYAAARASTLTAFYTPAPVAGAIHAILAEHGIGTGSGTDAVLEPGCGTGNFIGTAPEGARLSFTGVECDPLSARIAQALNPASHIVGAGLEGCRVSEASFEAVVGNVPYSQDIRFDLAGRTLPVHDYFILRSLEAVRPGGVVAVLTSRYTLDKADLSARRLMAGMADLVGCVRLPEETFRAQAGTDVVSDILVFQRRAEDAPAPEADPLWVGTVESGTGRPVNAWVAAHPEAVVGETAVVSGPFGPDITVRSGFDAEAIGAAAHGVLSGQMGGLGDLHEAMEAHGRAEEPSVMALPGAVVPNSYIIEGGQVWYGGDEAVEPVLLKSARDQARLTALVALRDMRARTLALERSRNATEAEVEAAIAALSAAYDGFVAEYGHVNSRQNERVYNARRDDAGWSAVASLEVVGDAISKAPVLTGRVMRPAPAAPDHAGSAEEALAISFATHGRIDRAHIASLLGIEDEGGVLERAVGDAVVTDPDTGEWVDAATYLSGNVGEKVEHVRRLIAEAADDGSAEAHAAWLEAAGISTPFSSAHGRTYGALQASGAWDAVTDPYGASAYNPNLWLRVESEREDRGVSYEEREQDVRELFWHMVSEMGPASRTDLIGYGTRNRILRACGDTPLAMVALLARSGLPRDYGGWLADRALMRALDRDEASGHLASLLSERFGIEGFRGWRAARCVAERIEDILADVPFCEYLAAAEAHAATTATELELSEDDFAAFSQAREDFIASRIREVDAERVEALEGLRDRLEAVAPPRVAARDINIEMGAAWVPAALYHQFMTETFGVDSEGARLTVSRDDALGEWVIDAKGARMSEAARTGFGTPHRNPIQLARSIMNNGSTRVTYKDAEGREVTDAAQTEFAWEKRATIEAEWKKWCVADEGRAAMLEDIYNRRFNSIVVPTFDGSALTFPGMASDIELRPWQKDVVARVLHAEEGTLMAHAVGAGKTFSGCAMAMEAKRLGRAQKPMIAVPNHLVDQWASDFQRLYPGASIIVMGDADKRDPRAVKAFWARVASGTWDAVIVPHSQFDRLSVSLERRMRYLREEVDAYMDAIEGAAEGSATVKKLERARSSASRRLKKLSEEKSDGLSTFEDTGCDFLFVDESHAYKNLAVPSSMAFGGLSSTPSMRASACLDKCKVLREEGHGGNIVFATGTPVSNSMAELYALSRYLAPGMLRQTGNDNFAFWAKNFASVTVQTELKPEGTGFRQVRRFSKFNNLPELMQTVHSFMDVKTADDLDLDVPECEVSTVAVEPSESQRELMQEFSDRADRVRSGAVDPSADNLLKITSDLRKCALDPRLLAPDDEDVVPLAEGKVARCAEKVAEIWRESAGDLGCQVVFCDFSTGSSKRWNVWEHLRDLLVVQGVPESEVGLVAEGGTMLTPAKKERLFEQVRQGKVRVIIGSTESLGTGTNIQDRLVALHDLDVAWRPSDLEQRLGRIVRQGNRNQKVAAYRWITVGTGDASMWQTVERKARFIGQVISNESPSREMDDTNDNQLEYAQIKAIATGNPKYQQLFELENDLERARRQASAQASQRAAQTRKLEEYFRPRLERAQGALEAALADRDALASVHALFDGAAGWSVAVGGRVLSDRKEANVALADAIGRADVGTTEIGSVGPMAISVKKERQTDMTGGSVYYVSHLVLTGKHEHVCRHAAGKENSCASAPVAQIGRMAADLLDTARLTGEFERARAEYRGLEAAIAESAASAPDVGRMEAELAAIKGELGLLDEEGRSQESAGWDESVDAWGGPTPGSVRDAARDACASLGARGVGRGRPEAVR